MSSIKTTYLLLGIALGLAITDGLILLGRTPKNNDVSFIMEAGTVICAGFYIMTYENLRR